MAAMAPRSFAFVPADDFGMPRATDRKFIRSHCMKGKNKRKGAHAVTSVPPIASYDVPQATKSPLPSLSASVSGPVQSKSCRSYDPLCWDAGRVIDMTVNGGKLQAAVGKEFSIPPPPPVDLSLVKFAGEVDGHSRELLFKYFNVARNMAYPVDLNIDFDLNRTIWFQWLSDDVAYLHSVLLASSFIHDSVMQRPPAKTTYFHLRKTIALLNEHLSDSTMSFKDSTVAVVITLAMLADVFGDYAAVRAHIAGLQQMVRIRGGLKGFCENTKLHIKIRHLDLSLSLNTGAQPHFSNDPVSWNPIADGFIPVPAAGGYDLSHNVQSDDKIGDRRLVLIFRDLQYFVGLINAATGGSNRRLRDTEFQNFTCSIQYRLLQLQDVLENVLDECIRLAMLAFLTTTFPIPGKKLRFPYLASRLRECCNAVETATPKLQDLILWLLMVGAISVYSVDELWLCKRWQADMPNLDWPEARQRLQEIMWINAIHDKPGKCAFELISSQEIV